MEEKAKDIWSRVKETAGGLSKTVKIVIVAAVVAALAGLAILVAWNSNTEYVPLFTGLTSEDMSSITKYLNENGVTEFKIEGTDTITVPKDQDSDLKAKLLAEGFPSSGTDYALYLDHISSLATESDRAMMYLFDLQDRLAGTIRRFDGVKDAVVNITQGEDRRYVLSQDNIIEASASVVVTMEEKAVLNQKLAESIRATVSHAVKGLVIDNVDIRDSEGNTYDEGDVQATVNSTAAQLKMELEEEQNKKLQKQVMDVLIPIFGEGNVAVSVNTTVDVSISTSESTEFSQPDWAGGNTNGKGIIGSYVWSAEIVPGDEGTGGVPGTTTNSDFPNYVENFQPTGDEEALKGSGQTDFENNKTTTTRSIPAGIITDVTVAVSINSEVPNTTNPQDLVGHVGRAAGILPAQQNDKISVISHQFYRPDTQTTTQPVLNPFADIPLWVYLALLAGLFLFMLLFTVFVLLGRRRNRKNLQMLEPVAVITPEDMIQEELPVVEAAEEPAGADIMDVHTEKSMELRKNVRELAEKNPEIAAQMIKALLKGDENANG